MIFEDLGLLFFTALILSLLLTPASITFAHYIGAVDDPVGRSVHTQAMTRLGGLGMTAATIVALLLFYPMTDYMTALLLGVTCMVAVGVIDDLVQISPSKKMAGQILACVIFLGLSGLSIHSFGDLFGSGEIVLGEELAFLVTLFCMLGIINAFNLSDGLDGLAAGLTVVASIFMIVLAIYTQHWFVLATLLALLGGLLGFLKYNTHPAKLFMGDTGSLALGFFMACTVVYLVNVESTMLLQPMTLALILAVPLSDTLIVMTRRILQGKSPVSPDKTHLHHRLLALGFSHAVVVILMYILSFACGALAMLVYQEPAWLQLLVGLVFCLCVYVALTWMEHQQCDASLWSLLSQQEKELGTKLAVLVTKSLRWLRLTILVGLILPITFVHSVPESVSGLLLAIFVLLLFAFPWREHRERLNIVYGLFYLSGLSILYVWNISTYQDIEMSWYTLCFVLVLTIWSALKIRFKGSHEVFLTSGLEVLLIFTSWFVPYVLLPALQVPDEILQAVKTSCLEAIPLFIAMKIVIRRDPSRNKGMVVGLLVILLLMMMIL